MATVQKNGSSAVTSTSTVNNGGVMTANGTSASNKLRSENTASNPVGVFASTVVSGVNTAKPLSGGTFAYNEQRPVAKKLTSTLAGTVSNTFLRSGAEDPGDLRSINFQTKVRTQRTTTAIRANKWNECLGVWESSYPVNTTDNFFNPATSGSSSTSTDEAAQPTRLVPGELTYLQGNPVPKLDNYKAKTNY